MQALSAAIWYSWGLAKALLPPSSQGSSMLNENRRGTSSPPIRKPKTSARLRVCPCQVVVTRQLVLPVDASCSTRARSATRSSTLMPLTTLGWVVSAAEQLLVL
jgi:hypothetical protein